MEPRRPARDTSAHETREGEANLEQRPKVGANGTSLAAGLVAAQREAQSGMVAPLVDEAAVPGEISRPATTAERMFWNTAFQIERNDLALALINRYMDGTGALFNMTAVQMRDVAPNLSIRASAQFRKILERLVAQQQSNPGHEISEKIAIKAGDNAALRGTLGSYDIYWDGLLRVNGATWEFTGTVEFRDVWDFDAKPAGERSGYREMKTMIGAKFLPGRGFPVHGGPLPVTESSAHAGADHGMGRPMEQPLSIDNLQLADKLGFGKR